jgi:hypothetical protein
MNEPLGEDIVFKGPNELDLGLAKIRLTAVSNARMEALNEWLKRDAELMTAALEVLNLEKLRDPR